MLRRTISIIIISLVLGFILGPNFGSKVDLQGRLISAPSYYVRSKLFDADFVVPLAEASRSKDFFYPLRIREQAELSRSGTRRDAKYARDVNEAHVRFGSKVRVVANSVSHVDIEEDQTYWGQTVSHQFSFSEMEGNNGTRTIMEYIREWKGSVLISALHERGAFPEWIGKGLERIDSLSVDAFVKAVETAWNTDYYGLKIVDVHGEYHTLR